MSRGFRTAVCAVAVIVSACALVFAGASVALADSSGPYVSTVSPGDGTQNVLILRRVGIGYRRSVFVSVAVDDYDMIRAGSQTLSYRIPGMTTATVTPTLTYLDQGQTKALLTYEIISVSQQTSPYTATISVADTLGNVSQYSWSFYVYETSPDVPSTSPARSAIATSPLAPVRWTLYGGSAAVNVSSIAAQIDGATVTVATSSSGNTTTATYTPGSPLSDATHTASVTFRNASNATCSYSWPFRVISSQPKIESVVPANGAAVAVAPDGSFSVSGSVLAAARVTAGTVQAGVTPPGGSTTTITASLVYSVACDRTRATFTAPGFRASSETGGAYALRLIATDGSGSTVTRDSTFTVPAIPPDFTSRSPYPVSSIKHPIVSETVTDWGSGVDSSTISMTFDGSPVSPSLVATSQGYVVYYDPGTLSDNTTHTVTLRAADMRAAAATDTWSFHVDAGPALTSRSPLPGATVYTEDVTVTATFLEPDDLINAASALVTFDGASVSAATSLSPSGAVATVTAPVHSVMGSENPTHTVVVTLRDRRGTATTVTWSFAVRPPTGSSDMPITENFPCAYCHVGLTDYAEWDQLHWIVGPKPEWAIPTTGQSHVYNCRQCHYSEWDPVTRTYVGEVIVDGLSPCGLCHQPPYSSPQAPTGPHGGTNGVWWNYTYRDHSDASRYEVTAPRVGRDCVYCHQGPKGSNSIDVVLNGTEQQAHDVTAQHRVVFPDDSCGACHSAVLTREHAKPGLVDAQGKPFGCHTCHDPAVASPTVIGVIRNRPPLRYRFWGTSDSTYNVSPVPTVPVGVKPPPVENGSPYSIPSRTITAATLRLTQSTVGTFTVSGYWAGAWHDVYSANIGGASDQSPGGKTLDRFPVYPSLTQRIVFPQPAEKVAVRYAPGSLNWAYVEANLGTWETAEDVPITCADCHSTAAHPDADHTADVTGTLDPSGFTCGDCHQMALQAEHERSSASSAGRSCWTCHPFPRDTFTTWNQTCQQGGCHAVGSSTEQHAGQSAAHAVPSASAACAAPGCHGGGDLATLHSSVSTVAPGGGTVLSCTLCHSAASVPSSAICSSSGCHPDKLDGGGNVVPHGNADPVKHTASVATQTVSGTWPSSEATGSSARPYSPPYPYSAQCQQCHDMIVFQEHAKASADTSASGCAACHPTPRDTLNPWGKSCTQGGCHPVGTQQAQHSDITTKHAMSIASEKATCGRVNDNGAAVNYPCHYRDIVQEHNRVIVGLRGYSYYQISVSCVQCHTSSRFQSVAGTWDGSCQACHTDSHAVLGTARYAQVHALHDNPAGLYDDGYGVSGSNAMDAMGPPRSSGGNPSSKDYGCSATTCHTSGYYSPTQAGYSVVCFTCHMDPNVAPVTPYAGTYQWDSGQPVGATRTLTLAATTLPSGAYLDFRTWYEIEQYWDWGYVEISTNGGSTWSRVAGSITTTANPTGRNEGNGVTGISRGWVAAHFDLSPYSGTSVRLRFRYRTDTIFTGRGWLLDDIVIGGSGGPVFTDGAESLRPEWTVGGWTRSLH